MATVSSTVSKESVSSSGGQYWVSQKTFFCPINTFYLSVKGPHIWKQHNETNISRIFLGHWDTRYFVGSKKQIFKNIQTILHANNDAKKTDVHKKDTDKKEKKIE